MRPLLGIALMHPMFVQEWRDALRIAVNGVTRGVRLRRGARKLVAEATSPLLGRLIRRKESAGPPEFSRRAACGAHGPCIDT